MTSIVIFLKMRIANKTLKNLRLFQASQFKDFKK